MSTKEVKVYSTPTCSYCKMAKKFLDDNKIHYQDINVAEDKATLKDMIDRSGQIGVPAIEIDGEFVIGFDREKLKEKLEIQ